MKRLYALLARADRWLATYVDAEERRLVTQAVIVGFAVWAVVFALRVAVHHGFEWLVEFVERGPSVALVLVPLVVGSLVVAAIGHSARKRVVYYRDGHGKLHALNAVEGDGLERAISLYFSSEPAPERSLLGDKEQGVQARWRLPTFTLTVRKWLATLVTLSTGGSGGLEASVALVGESVAAGLFKPRPRVDAAGRRARWFGSLWDWWRSTNPEYLQAAQLCGISAAVATLLGTPFAAAFFAIEVMYRRRPIVDRLIYALVSAIVAFFLGHIASGQRAFVPRLDEPPPVYEARYYAALFAVAVTIAVVGVAFRRLRSVLEHLFYHRIRHRWQRHVLGALITGLLALAVAAGLAASGLGRSSDALRLVLGTGESVIEQALHGQLPATLALVALAARLPATVATISSGGSAGLLYPTLCFGTLAATLWAEVFGMRPEVLIVPAMTASLVSIVNVPLAAILLVIEQHGATFVVPALFMLVTASIISHENSIYRPQRETFDDRQILPGMSVRRVRVPASWEGLGLRDLRVRQQYGLTVIGMIDQSVGADGALDTRTVLNPRPDQPLTEGDILIVLGEDDRLDALEVALRGGAPPPSPDEDVPPSAPPSSGSPSSGSPSSGPSAPIDSS